MANGTAWDGPPEVQEFLKWYGRYEMATTHGTDRQQERTEREYRVIFRDLVADDNDVETDF